LRLVGLKIVIRKLTGYKKPMQKALDHFASLKNANKKGTQSTFIGTFSELLVVQSLLNQLQYFLCQSWVCKWVCLWIHFICLDRQTDIEW